MVDMETRAFHSRVNNVRSEEPPSDGEEKKQKTSVQYIQESNGSAFEIKQKNILYNRIKIWKPSLHS